MKPEENEGMDVGSIQSLNETLGIMDFGKDLISEISPDSKIDFCGGVNGMVSFEFGIEGAGYGELLLLQYQAATMAMK